MHADDLVVNDGCAGQAIEGIAKLLPKLDGEPSTAFVIKTINSVNSRAFMISTEYEKIFRVFNFVSEE